jgi:hypothetical protein
MQDDLSPGEVENAIRDEYGTNLPRSLSRCTVAREHLSSYWWIDRPESAVTGEFNLRPPCASLPVYPPSADWVMPEIEKEISQQFLLIDDFPEGGTDAYVALLLNVDTESLEIWYHGAECGALKLDLDYCRYLRTLAITKGALGWHFLFADVSLSQPEFRSYIKELKGMLTVLPELFPDYDYMPLWERLEARL